MTPRTEQAKDMVNDRHRWDWSNPITTNLGGLRTYTYVRCGRCGAAKRLGVFLRRFSVGGDVWVRERPPCGRYRVSPS